MSNLPACPQCTLENTYPDGDNYVCPDCGFEWSQTVAADGGEQASGPVKDANGNPLTDGVGDHEVDGKTDQGAFMLKAEFMKKA